MDRLASTKSRSEQGVSNASSGPAPSPRKGPKRSVTMVASKWRSQASASPADMKAMRRSVSSGGDRQKGQKMAQRREGESQRETLPAARVNIAPGDMAPGEGSPVWSGSAGPQPVETQDQQLGHHQEDDSVGLSTSGLPGEDGAQQSERHEGGDQPEIDEADYLFQLSSGFPAVSSVSQPGSEGTAKPLLSQKSLGRRLSHTNSRQPQPLIIGERPAAKSQRKIQSVSTTREGSTDSRGSEVDLSSEDQAPRLVLPPISSRPNSGHPPTGSEREVGCLPVPLPTSPPSPFQSDCHLKSLSF